MKEFGLNGKAAVSQTKSPWFEPCLGHFLHPRKGVWAREYLHASQEVEMTILLCSVTLKNGSL